jgi:hypothetical protein
MSSTVKDCLGNDLNEGDIVAVVMERPVIFKIASIEKGGYTLTVGGPAHPDAVRITCDLTIRTTPGAPLTQLVKVVRPTQ